MEIGATLPSFNLMGTDRQMHHSDTFAEVKALVVVFTCNHCPYARAYISRIKELAGEFADQPVTFFAINANDASKYPEDSFEKMIPMGDALGLKGLYLYDESQEIASAFGAQRTPEVFLFNKNRELAYKGAIDDNWEFPAQVSQHFLAAAIEAVLNNETVQPSSTGSVGCTIKWKN